MKICFQLNSTFKSYMYAMTQRRVVEHNVAPTFLDARRIGADKSNDRSPSHQSPIEQSPHRRPWHLDHSHDHSSSTQRKEEHRPSICDRLHDHSSDRGTRIDGQNGQSKHRLSRTNQQGDHEAVSRNVSETSTQVEAQRRELFTTNHFNAIRTGQQQ